MTNLVCKECSKPFTRTKAEVKRRPSLYCSRRCSNKSRTTVKPKKGEKWCSSHGKYMLESLFRPKDKSWCRECSNANSRKWYNENKEQALAIRKKGYLKRNYGITVEEHQKMLLKGCLVCGKANYGKRDLAIDHSHISGKIRGMLCGNCNMGLGLFQDNPELLIKAARYLRK